MGARPRITEIEETDMNWTKELPTRRGWYWHKYSPDYQPIMTVHDGREGDPIYGFGCESDGRWYGPLEPPADEDIDLDEKAKLQAKVFDAIGLLDAHIELLAKKTEAKSI